MTFYPPALKRSDVKTLGLVGCAYFALHQLAFVFPDASKVLMAVWPASGIGLAILLLVSKRLWFYVLPLLFVAGIAGDLLSERSLITSVGFMTANILESWGCAWLIHSIVSPPIKFDRVKETVALCLSTFSINSMTSLLGAWVAVHVSHASLWSHWLTWWVAHGLGLILITPFIVTWYYCWDIQTKLSIKINFELILFVILLCLTSYLESTLHHDPLFMKVESYLLVILLLWPALRLGMRATSLSLVMLTFEILLNLLYFEEPSHFGGHTFQERLLLAQVFLGFTTTITLILATSYSETKLAWQSAHKLLKAVENSPAGIVITNHQGIIEYVNKYFTQLTGYLPEEVYGKKAAILKGGTLSKEFYQNLWQTILEGNVWRGEFLNRKKNGKLFWELASISPITNAEGTITHFVAIKEDASKQKEAENVFFKARQRLAQDLHDSTIQSLFAVGMSLESCRRALNHKELAEQTSLTFESCVKEINEAIHDVRGHIMEFRTGTIHHMELSPILKAVCARFARTASIRIQCEIEDHVLDTLNDQQANHLLYITREVISNNIRHSESTWIQVNLSRQTDATRLEIRADGHPFDPEIAAGNGMGLDNIQSRCQQMNATFTWNFPKMEVHLQIDVPIEKTENEPSQTHEDPPLVG